MELLYKVIDKFRSIFVGYINRLGINNYFYKSFWHYKLFKSKNIECENKKNFFTARPNPGAGIGHQMANWIAGYWFSKKFNLRFSHIPFSTSYIPYTKSEWEDFLGFGDREELVESLLKDKGYKKVRLPYFDENSSKDTELIKGIIDSYCNRKVVFIAEQDQFYKNQFEVMDDLKQKFFGAEMRKYQKLIFDKDNFNIAIHVRRGDIIQVEGENNENLSQRWQSNKYFVNVLRNTLSYIKTNKKIKVYLFSQGKISDFKEFSGFENIEYCLDMSAMNSFLHMVYADVLITSKSSFSYKPALLNQGIKICPQNFWHGYPNDKNWILVDEEGNLIK